jgi:hypothetical protein
MRPGTLKPPIERGDLLPTSPIAESVAQRAGQVTDLVLKRRKIALAYKRTQSDDNRIALEALDHDLAKHNIHIPAIRKSAVRRKEAAPSVRPGNAEPLPRDSQAGQGNEPSA